MLKELIFGIAKIVGFIFVLAAEGEDFEQELDDSDPNAGRFVRYQFTPQFLKLKTVGATYVHKFNLF